MILTININIENARKTLIMSAGSLEEANIYKNMSDEEVKDKVLQHCRCWSIEEIKNLSAWQPLPEPYNAERSEKE